MTTPLVLDRDDPRVELGEVMRRFPDGTVMMRPRAGDEIEKGEGLGHTFRGNQWTGGRGGGGTMEAPDAGGGGGKVHTVETAGHQEGGYAPSEVDCHSHMSSVTKVQQQDIKDHLGSLGYDEEAVTAQCTKNFIDGKTLSSEPVTGRNTTCLDEGDNWYPEIGAALAKEAPTHGLTPSQYIGGVAALCSNNVWENKTGSTPNLDVARRVAALTALDPEITITDADIAYWNTPQPHHPSSLPGTKGKLGPREPGLVRQHIDLTEYKGTHRMSELPADVVARIGNGPGGVFVGSGSNTGWPNIAMAIECYRGKKTPDEVLTGPKRRSFHNAFISLGRSDDPVMDRWMVRALTGCDANQGFKQYTEKPPFKKGRTAAEQEKYAGYQNLGSYPALADTFRKACNRMRATGVAPRSMTDSDIQAVLWYQTKVRDEMDKAAAREKAANAKRNAKPKGKT